MKTKHEIQAKIDELKEDFDSISPLLDKIAVAVMIQTLEWVLEGESKRIIGAAKIKANMETTNALYGHKNE